MKWKERMKQIKKIVWEKKRKGELKAMETKGGMADICLKFHCFHTQILTTLPVDWSEK